MYNLQSCTEKADFVKWYNLCQSVFRSTSILDRFCGIHQVLRTEVHFSFHRLCHINGTYNFVCLLNFKRHTELPKGYGLGESLVLKQFFHNIIHLIRTIVFVYSLIVLPLPSSKLNTSWYFILFRYPRKFAVFVGSHCVPYRNCIFRSNKSLKFILLTSCTRLSTSVAWK